MSDAHDRIAGASHSGDSPRRRGKSSSRPTTYKGLKTPVESNLDIRATLIPKPAPFG